MILDWLAQSFGHLFAHDSRARIVLWCDVGAEFRQLLPVISERLAIENIVLLAFDSAQHHGALWLKWATEVGPGAGKKVVLWLPYADDDLTHGAGDGTRLDCLLEYTYGGLVWLIDGKAPSLFAFLKKHGVPLPTQQAERDALCKGGPESALAKYVRVNLGRDGAFWQAKPLSLAVIEEGIVGNVEEHLLQFLADPARKWEELAKAGIAGEFASQVAARYADTAKLGADPQVWAKDLVTSLALLEVFEATGQPADFPFATRLSPAPRRAALRELLSHWMLHPDHRETYRRWVLELEKSLHLAKWADGKSGRPQALCSLAAGRWARFLEGLRQQGASEEGLRRYLQEHRQAAQEEAQGFWAKRTGDLPGWQLAVDLAGLVEHADQALEMAKGLKTAARLVDAYERDWHQIDLAHWRLLAAARQADEMELLATVADRFYARYLEGIGLAFYNAFRNSGIWPPPDCRPITELAAQLYAPATGRRAILVIDALRFDLARALHDRLGEGTLEAYVANVPSDTYVGMTSLLPSTTVRLSIDEGKPRLFSEAAGGDLCFRPYRWKLLQAAGAAPLGKDKKGALRDEIPQLWEFAQRPKDLPSLLVLFDQGVDAPGHSAGHEVLQHFEQTLDELARAIRKLKAWGYTEIHVVTDHGFVLLHSGANIQPMAVDKDHFALLNARSGYVSAGQRVGTAIVPFVLDPSWSVALPPGVRSFAAVGTYFHGGATLQETVVPHLYIKSATTRQRMRARVLVPKVEIATLTVKVELVPEQPEPTQLFEAEPERIRVRVFLGQLDAPRSEPKTFEFGPGAKDAISMTLFLNREPPIPAGTEIPVQVIDEETGEAYVTGLFVRAMRDLG